MTAIAEKYSRAIGSSHLEWRIDPGAIDMLTAAGMVDESLGTGLLRLRAEFDSISAMPGARHMMPRLKSAASVRTRLLAMMMQTKRCPLSIDTDQHMLDMAAKLLDHWLSPQCPTCTGRGQIGAYGEPQHICTACGGSKRRSLFWKHDEQEFADRIACEMEEKVDSAARRIRRLLQQG